jgi:hypothetical protein
MFIGGSPTDALPKRIRFVAPGERWITYRDELARMGGIVEAFVVGAEVRSPSVQCTPHSRRTA